MHHLLLHLLVVHKLLLLTITLHDRLAIHIDHAGVHGAPIHLLLIHHLLLLHCGVFVHHLLPSAIFLHLLLLVVGGRLLGTVGAGSGIWRGSLLDLGGLLLSGIVLGLAGLLGGLLAWLLLLTLSWLLLFRLVAHILNIVVTKLL